MIYLYLICINPQLVYDKVTHTHIHTHPYVYYTRLSSIAPIEDYIIMNVTALALNYRVTPYKDRSWDSNTRESGIKWFTPDS